MNVPAIRSFVCFVVLLSCSPASGQVPWSATVRIQTADSGSGSGFVVATKSGQAEIWTNGHVAGRTGSSVTVRWGDGSQTSSGRVIESTVERSNGTDVAKIVAAVPVGAVVSSLAVGRSDWDWNGGSTSGWPLGLELHSIALRKTNHRPSIGTSYLPPAIPGQSGSAVTDKEGKVVGVVTWTFGLGRQRYGVFQPIENWTGETKAARVGSFTVAKVQEIGRHYASDKK